MINSDSDEDSSENSYDGDCSSSESSKEECPRVNIPHQIYKRIIQHQLISFLNKKSISSEAVKIDEVFSVRSLMKAHKNLTNIMGPLGHL